MRRSRIDDEDYKRVARELNLPFAEVRKAVLSFFSEIAESSDRLPLDSDRKIYTREAFQEFEYARCIPYIGRIGPVYSRYLKWRANVAADTEQEPKDKYRQRLTKEDMDAMARDILAGREPSMPEKKRASELYHRIWMVGTDKKRMARQVIPKKKEDV